MENIIKFIRETFNTQEFVPLHEPRFIGNEKRYLNECIDSTFVSSVGKFVDEFEKEFAKFVGSKYAIATVNGTSALHIALLLAGVKKDDEVITQALTFVATTNAISYAGAKPIFLDVDLETMGLSPKSVKNFLETNCILENGVCRNKKSGKKVKAIVPMHTFGHPVKIDEFVEIAENWNIKIVEDSAESLGSFYKGKHTGTFGDFGVFSFNGNKIITSGGGGVIVTDNEVLAKKAKHLTTTAKIPHKWEYIHDEVGYNYRMPNLNASLLVAQLENLNLYLENKRDLAEKYKKFFQNKNLKFIEEPKNSKSNYWLNAILLRDKNERDNFLEMTNKNGVMTRPIWKLMNELEISKNYQTDDLKNSKYLADRVVNIPSSVRV
jgi:perosamine synthetase